MGKRKTKTLAERFWPKVQAGEAAECWPWTGATDTSGYGQIREGGVAIGAHRVSVMLRGEVIPPGYVIDHLCRNPSCVNPAHLEVVTMAENTRRGRRHELQKAQASETHFCQRGHPLPQVTRLLNSAGHRYCIPCQRAAANRWKAENRDRVNELQQRRRAAARAA